MSFNKIDTEIDYLKFWLNEIDTEEKQVNKILIQEEVRKINLKLYNQNISLNSILEEVKDDFNFEFFIDSQKSKKTFEEINPQKIFEKEKKERIEFEKLEILRKQKLENEKIKKQKIQKEQLAKQINITKKSFVKNMYYNGPEDLEELASLIKIGFNVSDSIYPIIRLIEKGRTINFFIFLINHGLRLNRKEILIFKKKNFFKSPEFINSLLNAEQINTSIVNEILQK